MSDLALRTAARQAALDGSLEARAALLRERLRAGTLDPERVRLAAWCGDASARIVLEEAPPSYGHRQGLGPGACLPQGSCWKCGWVNTSYGLLGLAHWDPWVQARAATTAAWIVLRLEFDRSITIEADGEPVESAWDLLKPEARRGYCGGTDVAIAWEPVMAAEAWLACPCEEHRAKPGEMITMGEPAWAWEFACAISDLTSQWPHNAKERLRQFYGHATRLAGEVPVRGAICRGLVEWALA